MILIDSLKELLSHDDYKNILVNTINSQKINKMEDDLNKLIQCNEDFPIISEYHNSFKVLINNLKTI